MLNASNGATKDNNQPPFFIVNYVQLKDLAAEKPLYP